MSQGSEPSHMERASLGVEPALLSVTSLPGTGLSMVGRSGCFVVAPLSVLDSTGATYTVSVSLPSVTFSAGDNADFYH